MFRRSCISSYKNGFLRCTRPETALVSEKGKKTKLVDGVGGREAKVFLQFDQQKRAPGNVLSYVQIIGREATYAYAHTNGYSGR